MVSLGDSSINMFQHEDFDLYPSSHHNGGGLYMDMLQTRQDTMFTIPTTQAFEHSLEDQYSSATMTSYESYPPASPYFSVPRSFYDQPQFVVNAPQDLSKQQFFAPTPAVSPAHSISNSFDPPPSALSSASGASVPSAPSSSMGSPYSGAHMLQGADSWSESSTQGLGIRPSIIHSDFSDETFGSVGLDHGSIYAHDKISSGFVGEYTEVSSSPQIMASSPLSQSVFLPSLSAVTPASSVNQRARPSYMTIDTILDEVNGSIDATPSPESVIFHRGGQSSSPFKAPSTPASARSPTPIGPYSPNSRRRSYSTAISRTNSRSSTSSRLSNSVRAEIPSPVEAGEQTPAYGNFQSTPFFSQSSGNYIAPLQASYPSLINPFQSIPSTVAMQADMSLFQSPQIPQFHPPSPAPSNSSARSVRPGSANLRTGSHSPYRHAVSYKPYPQYSPHSRRPSTSSARSHISGPNSQRGSPGASSVDEEAQEKGKCMECGKVFKDLKAHMLTHLHERPEKCPILTCEYHQKGFARKYDKNRHTLTHYKGTMVCGFCPHSGSAAEKSFNRADVFKRHLTSVHNVEQAPPNSRKKTSSSNAGNKFPTYAADATGKCSTCSGTFSNAQDFYEHLDECVLRVVQQEDPSAAINERNIASVNDDEAVQQTMRANALPLNTTYVDQEENFEEDDEEAEEEEEDFEKDDDKDESWKASGANTASGRTPSTRARSGTVKRSGSGSSALSRPNQSAQPSTGRGCISKVRRSGSGGRAGTFTFSKGGVPVVNKSKKRRKNLPPSWGCSADKMTMKKRGLYVFDGPRRLWKDDMMLSNEFEVRINLNDGKYFTDLDDLTVKRAEAIHDATEEEKGPWVDDDINIKELMS